jgi:hypothetical protein
MHEKDLTYRSPLRRATQAANSLWGKNSINCEKIVRPRFMCRVPVVSGIMTHSEIQIVPALSTGILSCSQSVILFDKKFPWTPVTVYDFSQIRVIQLGHHATAKGHIFESASRSD